MPDQPSNLYPWNSRRGNALVLRLPIFRLADWVCQPHFFFFAKWYSAKHQSFSNLLRERRLLTTARFWFSILPESTRERVLQSRYAGNQHHGNFFKSMSTRPMPQRHFCSLFLIGQSFSRAFVWKCFMLPRACFTSKS